MDLFGNRVERRLDQGNNGTIEERTTYSYDENDRLLEEIAFDVVQSVETERTRTTYEWQVTQQAAKTVRSAAGQVQTRQEFGYDLHGRLARVVSETRNASDAVTSRQRVDYAYDQRGVRIRAATSTDSNKATSEFEAVSGEVTEYLVDHNNFTGYAQTVEERTLSASGQLVKQITYTFGYDELVQVTTDYDSSGLPSPASRLVFGHDGLTNVRVLFGAAASIAQAYTFAAYGQLLAVHNALGSSTLSNFELLTSHLSDGEYFDSRIGQTYLRARWYEPKADRFSQLDSFKGKLYVPESLNKYTFVHSDPIQGIDPSGLLHSTIGTLGAISIGSQNQAQGNAAS